MSADARGPEVTAAACGPDGCGDCTLACAGEASTPAGEDLAVAAAGGIAIAVLAGILALGAPIWVAVLAGGTALAGFVLAVAALVARSQGSGVATPGPPVRLLPVATGGLVLTVLARATTTLLG